MATILIVDDNQVFQKLLADELSARGYEIIGASDGIDAQDKLKLVEPALIVLDLNMPKMDGMQFLHAIRELYDMPIPVLIVSQNADFSQIADGFELGVRGYIVKSDLSTTQIADRIDSVITEL